MLALSPRCPACILAWRWSSTECRRRWLMDARGFPVSGNGPGCFWLQLKTTLFLWRSSIWYLPKKLIRPQWPCRRRHKKTKGRGQTGGVAGGATDRLNLQATRQWRYALHPHSTLSLAVMHHLKPIPSVFLDNTAAKLWPAIESFPRPNRSRLLTRP